MIKASPLKSVIIIISSIFTAIPVLLKGLFNNYSKAGAREKSHNLCLIFAKRMLNQPKIKRHYEIDSEINWEQPKKRYIIMSNHSSLYDIPVLFEAFDGRVRMLAKKELRKIPLFGITLSRNEFPYIDRKDRNQAKKDLAYARTLMENGIVLWTAPEGTRSKNGELLPFKKGVFHLAIEAEADIIPVGIKNANQVLPAKTLSFSLEQDVYVRAGKPISTSNFSKKQINDLMDKVRNEILELTKN